MYNGSQRRSEPTEHRRAADSGDREHGEGRSAKSTVYSATEEFKQIQETVGGAKSAVDAMFEHVKGTVKEMVEHVKPTADLLNDRQQNPWFLMGSAIVMGYILGSLARENTFVR